MTEQQTPTIEDIYARIQALDPGARPAAINDLDPDTRAEYYRHHKATGSASARRAVELKARRAESMARNAELKARRAAAIVDFQKRLDARLREISDEADQAVADAKEAFVVAKMRLAREHSLQIREIKRGAQDRRNSLTTRSWERFNEKYPAKVVK